MLFNTNAKKTLKSINYPLVAQLMSQVPGEERKKTANVSIFCITKYCYICDLLPFLSWDLGHQLSNKRVID